MARLHQVHFPSGQSFSQSVTIATDVAPRALPSCQYAGELRTLEEVLAPLFSCSDMTLTFHPGYDLANQTVYLDDMLRWGLGWLIKVSRDVCPLIHAHTPLHRRIQARTRSTCKSQTVLVHISHVPLHWLNSFVYS